MHTTQVQEMSLEKEIAYFDSKVEEWLKDGWEGQWAVIREQALVGTFDNFAAAIDAALDRFGPDHGALIRQIREDPPRNVFQRASFRKSS